VPQKLKAESGKRKGKTLKNKPIFLLVMPDQWNTNPSCGSSFRASQANGFQGPSAYKAEWFVGAANESVLSQALPEWSFLLVI